MIRIQTEDFSLDAEYQALRNNQTSKTGAICTFTGLVRDFGDAESVEGICLEHYPGMTEKCLQHIIDRAKNRWQLNAVSVIHRVGELALGEQIVFVGVSSAHRKDAFEACEFIMDYLKSEATIWKKEKLKDKTFWVKAKQSDQQSLTKWGQGKGTNGE